MLKKIIFILSVVLLCCVAVFSLTGCNNPSKIEFAFVTDTHIISHDIYTAENYTYHSSRDKMVHLSVAILNTVADDLIKNKTKYLLLGGDLTENGDLLSHQSCASILERVQNAGIKVFVINGNHDIAPTIDTPNKVSAQKFKEVYYEFGYKNAITTYENTLSYVADINEKYRLIAIDNLPYEVTKGLYKQDFDAFHAKWVEQQVDKCQQDGKTPIIMGHKPFIQHFPKVTSSFLERDYYAQCEKMLKIIADKGANYSLSGHMHMQDMKSITTESGNTFTDIESCSTVFLPSAYRMVKFSKKKVEVSTTYIQKLKEEYLSEFSPAQERLSVTTDYRNYCYKHFSDGVKNMVNDIISPNGMLGSLNFGGQLQTLIDILLPNVVEKIVNNPIYIKDESNNISLERIAKTYDITLPQTDYKTVADVVPFYIATLMQGDENIADCKENTLLKLAVKSIFYYIDQQSTAIKNAISGYEKINLDLNKLFKEGILECYDSNFMPVIISIVNSSISSGTVKSLLESIKTNFDALADFEVIIKIYTKGDLANITSYFDNKSILLDDLINDLFAVYLADLMLDTPPTDNYAVFKR